MNHIQVAFKNALAAERHAQALAVGVIDLSPVNQGEVKLLDPVATERHLRAHEQAQELWAVYHALKWKN